MKPTAIIVNMGRGGIIEEAALAKETDERTQERLSALREEMSDRFGAPPPALDRLYRTALCRILAAERGITRIRLHEGLLYLYRNGVPLRFHGRLPAPAGTTADELLDAVIRLIRVRPKTEARSSPLPG